MNDEPPAPSRHAPLTVSAADRRRIEALDRLTAGGRAAVPSLLDMLDEPSWTVRRAVVAGLCGDPRAVDPLTALLDDPHYTLEAARALGRTGDRRAVAPLLGLLARPADGEARVAAVALGELHGRYLHRYGEARAIQETA